MSTRAELLDSIAATIKGYRAEEIEEITPSHVDEWVKQFEEPVQTSILAELNHVLPRTYVSQDDIHSFLTKLLDAKELVAENPCTFWSSVNFLRIQKGGNSQREMLNLLDGVLNASCGLTTSQCGVSGGPFVYLDDVSFTGNRIKIDLSAWIRSSCPDNAELHVIVRSYHSAGQDYADRAINATARVVGKNLGVKWWRCTEIQDSLTNTADVLRPTVLPDDPLVREYVKSLKYAPVLRKPGSVGDSKFFSSEEGRHLLEQEFLKAGVRIRRDCPYLIKYQRPLGNMLLQTLGFGAMTVTYRNCPNNCPLALWAGDPWYPLFPRKTN